MVLQNNLKFKLTEFGLNPKDWILEPRSACGSLMEIQLRRCGDGDLVFVGWVENGIWLNLHYYG